MRRIATFGFLFAAALLPAADPAPRLDADGLPLPAEALRRFGSARFLTDAVSHVAFSPDGKTAYTLGYHRLLGASRSTGTLAAWEAATGKRLWHQEKPDSYPEQLAADPDGKHVWATLAGPQNQREESTLIRLKLSARTGEVADRTELFPRRFGGTALHPTGAVAWARFDTAASDLSMPITGPDGKEQARWEPEGEHVERACFSPDGKTLFIAGSSYLGGGSYKIRAVEAKTGKGLWAEESTQASRLTATPDGKHLLARVAGDPVPVLKGRGQANESRLRVLNAKTGKEEALVAVNDVYFGSSSSLTHLPLDRVVFHPDGKTALVPGPSLDSIPIDLTTWKAGKAEGNPAAFGWFAPDGKSYLTATGRTLRLFDAATHKPLSQAPAGLPDSRDGMQERTLAVDGSSITRLGGGGEVVWAVANGEELKRTTGANRIASPDGKRQLRYATGTGWEVATLDGKSAVVLEQAVGSRPRFSSDGAHVVEARTGQVRIWDAKTGGRPTVLAAIRPPDGASVGATNNLRFDPLRPRAAAFDPLERNLREWNMSVGLYDLTAAKRTGTVAVRGRITDWQFGPSGRLVLVSMASQPPLPARGVLTVAESGSETAATFDLDFLPSACAVSPDERTVAVGGSTGIHLYDLRTGARRHTFAGLTRAADALAFSPTGRYLASESADGPVLLWDVRGELLATPEPDAAKLALLWADLGSDDPAKAFQAVRTAAAHPAKSLPFLKARVAERKQPTADEIAARAAKLDAKDFAERDAAEKELRAMGAVAHPALKAALAGTPTPELRTRANRLLAVVVSPPALRAARLVEAVEWAGGKELLTEWAASDWPELKAEAVATLNRTKK